MNNRYCYLVVKNGNIVHEEYRNGRTESSIQAGFSTTKSSCAALFGIAVQQGWADVGDRVLDRISSNRNCVSGATFEDVLSMTGRHDDNFFSYDTFGTACLDTLTDFIGNANPDGLSANAWKNRYWQEALGMEHMRWNVGSGSLISPACGYGQDISCRDLARSGQLFLNDGVWDGQQLANAEYMRNSREDIPRNEDYGYTLWLEPRDPVDNKVSSHQGASGQCVYISKEHEALIVSMGNDGSCGNAWSAGRSAIVSNDHPRYAEIQASLATFQAANSTMSMEEEAFWTAENELLNTNFENPEMGN
jgi:CubicO group peptidase (beta-lactamase class C family)